MDLIIGTFYFIFGTIVGSFLNVVAIRYNSGKGIGGRSSCFSCGKNLTWSQLVPIFSFIYSLGRCGSCGSRISAQYPIVEFFTGLIFLGIFFKNLAIIESIYFLVVFSILIVILIYDIRHKIIPNGSIVVTITLFLSNSSIIL